MSTLNSFLKKEEFNDNISPISVSNDSKRIKLSLKLNLVYNHIIKSSSLLYCSYLEDPPNSNHMNSLIPIKIAAFDLDQTLIAPKSGKKYPKQDDFTDWKWLSSNIPNMLHQLYEDGFVLVIFSNQNGLGIDESGILLNTFERKIQSIFECLHIPIRLYAALGKDIYRKPRLGMWHEFIYNDTGVNNSTIDMQNSFFVGDAAGRLRGWANGKNADFADMDRKFAMNAKLRFLTPDTFFLSHEHELPELEFLPQDLLGSKESNDPYRKAESLIFKTNENIGQELIIIVGPPGCGKTSLYEDIFKIRGYVHINQDQYKGRRASCILACKRSLIDKKSVVVDNTNPSKKSRLDYIQIAKEHNIPIRCIILDVGNHLPRHLNKYRSLVNNVPAVPEVAYNVFEKQFEDPNLKEGFDEIIRMPFIPRNVDNPEWQAVGTWHWTLQKNHEDDMCGICRSAFDGCCPECVFPGEECPPTIGNCKHAFHRHCITKWLQTNTQCPMCRRQWIDNSDNPQ